MATNVENPGKRVPCNINTLVGAQPLGELQAMTILCSVIIPLYRRTEWIGRCLDALKAQQSDITFEVLIVDDGSPNNEEITSILQMSLADAKFMHQYIRIENGGPARARNVGVRHACGTILCFLDDDSIPGTAWLHEICSAFEMNSDVAVVSGPALSHDRVNGLPLLLEQTVYAGKSFATCNIAYRRDVFEKLGGFDESFREPSWEDNDLGLRAMWAGYTHLYSNTVKVYHPHEASNDEYRAKCLLNGRGAYQFSKKYLKIKPFWAIATPVIMSRRLIYFLSPSYWFGSPPNSSSVQFVWSWYSLKGYWAAMVRA